MYLYLQELGAPVDSMKDCIPSPTFNNGHPDPNLTYAHELVRFCLRDKLRDIMPVIGCIPIFQAEHK